MLAYVAYSGGVPLIYLFTLSLSLSLLFERNGIYKMLNK